MFTEPYRTERNMTPAFGQGIGAIVSALLANSPNRQQAREAQAEQDRAQAELAKAQTQKTLLEYNRLAREHGVAMADDDIGNRVLQDTEAGVRGGMTHAQAFEAARSREIEGGSRWSPQRTEALWQGLARYIRPSEGDSLFNLQALGKPPPSRNNPITQQERERLAQFDRATDIAKAAAGRTPAQPRGQTLTEAQAAEARRLIEKGTPTAQAFAQVQGFTDARPPSSAGRTGTGAADDQGLKTEAQNRANVFRIRAQTANDEIDALAAEGYSGSDAKAWGDRRLNRIGELVDYNLQSDSGSRFRTASDSFLTALLRIDTGAAVTEPELKLYGPLFLPGPGDGPDRLALKRRLREGFIRGLETSTGLRRLSANATPQEIAAARADVEAQIVQFSREYRKSTATGAPQPATAAPAAPGGGWSITREP